jgi:peptide chain release factor 1
MKMNEQQQERSEHRKSQIGTGDRSEKIRTYNFPQGRLTDHRIGLTIHRLTDVMEGNIDDIVDKLVSHYQAELLKEQMPEEPKRAQPGN